MARHPEWFERIEAIEEAVRAAAGTKSFGAPEIGAAFRSSYRESVRLLHRFGARYESGFLSVSRPALLAQLEAVRRGESYRAFLRQREGVAQQLERARTESAARRLRVRSAPRQPERAGLEDLPETLVWRRLEPCGPARFEIRYDDGEDLLWQLSEFLLAAGRDREEFFRSTEPGPA